MKWINKPNLKSDLLYRGSRDGFNALTFFNTCANAGPTLTLIRSKEKKYVFGGFASRSWQIPRNQLWLTKRDDEAFVFSLTKMTKHPLFNHERNALCMYKNGETMFGPCFGGCGTGHYDIIIFDRCNERIDNYSTLGHCYQLPAGMQEYTEEANSYLAGTANFTVDEIEVYGINYGNYA